MAVRKALAMMYSAWKVSPYSEFFWSVFSFIRTEYGEILSLCIQSECGKILTRKTPNADIFHAVVHKSDIGVHRVSVWCVIERGYCSGEPKSDEADYFLVF